ncbi:MAG: hypothetical protein ABSF95_05555 [Verrucomicrobiota bacterium]|jgi:hypothetical protein
MKLLTFTAPAILCAAIAFPALLFSAYKGSNWPQALLCAFLPGCFLLLANVLIRMNRDISRLRRRVARLEGKVLPGPLSPDHPDASGTAQTDNSVAPSSAAPAP